MSTEARHLFRLAVPVILSQVGAMTMGLVDSIIVGRYSSLELAGVAAGNSIFWTIVMLGFGLLHGMDPIVAEAHGSGLTENADRCLGSALRMGFFFSLFFTPLIILIAQNLWIIGATPEVVAAAKPFLTALSLSLWPLMVYGALQRYWQGFEIALPFTMTVIIANLVNWAGNYALVPGHWGMPALGALGAALATAICRIVCLFIAVAITIHYLKKSRPDALAHLWKLIITRDRLMDKRLLSLGVPASLQVVLEVFAFSFTTIMVTRLGAEILATHHIVLNIASFAFMFPLGLSSAIAVRVGFHRGRGRPREALRAGWQGILFAFLIMAVSSVILYTFPSELLGLFTKDPKVIAIGSGIIFLCVLFQVFDGVQVASAGALRGLGDTKTALYTNLIAHYGIGLPTGLYLCFRAGYGLTGLWIGLALGLSFTALLNTIKWYQKKSLLIS
ncbi:MAG: MATE family efflux transporter [Proteobacteria bacterium]|nr:MAG: MATE family efflux transporter [Pseudomonadota bacterium]